MRTTSKITKIKKKGENTYNNMQKRIRKQDKTIKT